MIQIPILGASSVKNPLGMYLVHFYWLLLECALVASPPSSCLTVGYIIGFLLFSVE